MLNIYKMKKRVTCYHNKFYLWYLGYTALETDLLFFMVCDTLFLTQAKGISMARISLLTFLSLVFSLLIQYPLLQWIRRVGNRRAVRAGSLAFLLSAVCITFAPGYAMILLGGLLKCVAHTLSAVGTALLKNRLAADGFEDCYVSCQSDANSLSSLVMLATAAACGALFCRNAYYPMYASLLCSLAGVGITYMFSRGEDDAATVLFSESGGSAHERRPLSPHRGTAAVLFASFAVFTALTGVGLSYAKLHMQAVLSNHGTDYAVLLLSSAAAILYLLRFLSNLLMRSAYRHVGNRAVVITSVLLLAGLLLQLAPRVALPLPPAFALCAGYLLLAFVRDPYTTLIQNIALTDTDPSHQQSMLIRLNGAKKLGALLLSAVSTLLMYRFDTTAVMLLMALAAAANLALCLLWFSGKWYIMISDKGGMPSTGGEQHE